MCRRVREHRDASTVSRMEWNPRRPRGCEKLLEWLTRRHQPKVKSRRHSSPSANECGHDSIACGTVRRCTASWQRHAPWRSSKERTTNQRWECSMTSSNHNEKRTCAPDLTNTHLPGWMQVSFLSLKEAL